MYLYTFVITVAYDNKDTL